MSQQKIKLKSPRGMKDHSPQDCLNYRSINSICKDVSQRFCYQEIQTPLLENAAVFLKTLGSEILNKELYQFIDKSSESLALRPEGTAGIVRSLIQENFYQNSLSRVFYTGPMFRYERPQKGRYRQFHQFGIEFFGESSASAEQEVIQMSQMILKELGVLPQCRLLINSIGDEESRTLFRKKLVQYLTPLKNKLSPESQIRLEKNPLRILDSKSKQDQDILKNSPRPIEYLNHSSKEFYQNVLTLLKESQIEFTQQDFLVRGLDYYNHTVFEWVSEDIGSQDALLAGGRYDQLVEMMGGPPTPAIGWACGIERLSLLCPFENTKPFCVGIVSIEDHLNPQTHLLAQKLRENKFQVYLPKETLSFSKKMKKISHCTYALILGSNEWKNNQVSVKNLISGKQENLKLDSLLPYLQEKIENEKNL